MPTKQETFDTVARHLLTQLKDSRDTFGCAYRGADGTKCAAGCLISDEHYDPAMERKAVFCMLTRNEVIARGKSADEFIAHEHELFRRAFDGHDYDLLDALQEVHDSNSVANWFNELGKVADKFQLNHDVLTEMKPGFEKWKEEQ